MGFGAVRPDPTFDRRRYPRIRSESVLSIARLDTDTALAHALDLSIGGVRFRCVGLEVRPRDVVRVTFTFSERSVTVVGQIVRVTALDDVAQEVAIRLLKMNDATRAILLEHLPKHDVEPIFGDDERRAFLRTECEAVVAVSRASVVDVVAQAQNLSPGGIHFIVEGLELELGEVLRVTIDCDGVPISTVGQLVRVTNIDDFKQEAALAFLDVSGDMFARIQSALTEPQDD
jgi:hypothetical protein